MGPERGKGERPTEREAGARKEPQEQGTGAPYRSIDEREDEGWGQPESSAQKSSIHPDRPEDEEMGE
jgi:hypothetical protein